MVPGLSLGRAGESVSFKDNQARSSFRFFGIKVRDGGDTATIEVTLEPGDYWISAWTVEGDGTYELTVEQI